MFISKAEASFVFPMCSRGKNKKELDFSNSLIFKALQDGLEPTTP